MPGSLAAERIGEVSAILHEVSPVFVMPVRILVLAEVGVGHHVLEESILSHDNHLSIVVVLRELLIL